MTKKKKILVWVLPILGILVAGGIFGYLKLFTWNPERQKLAVVNDRLITVAQFGREIAKVPPIYQEVFKEEPKEFLEQLVLKEVMLQEARRMGLKGEGQGEDLEVSMIQNLLKKEVIDKVQVSPEEVEGVYKQHKDQLGKKPLSEVAPLIENALKEAKGKEKLEEYIASVRKKSKIEINEKRLAAIAAVPPPTNSGDEFKKALQSGKPVLVDFGANNCMPCRQLRPVLKEIDKEYNSKASVLVIDVYKFKELAAEYKVQVIPTLVFFDKAGKEIYRHMGAWDKASIVNKMKESGAV
jgi:thioredoxin 1